MSLDHNAVGLRSSRRSKTNWPSINIKAVNYGVVGIPKDEAGARKIFEFAKKMGLHAITTESVDAIDTIEKLVKEYDICVGFHDHPKRANNPNYKMWDPQLHRSRSSKTGTRALAPAPTRALAAVRTQSGGMPAHSERPHHQQPSQRPERDGAGGARRAVRHGRGRHRRLSSMN